MIKSMMGAAAALCLMAIGGTASAAVIASSNFNTGDQGWTNGDLTQLGSTSAVTYNSGAGTISVTDNYGDNAFIAPTAYLGNQSAAIGGTFTFQTSDTVNDSLAYSPLALFGSGLAIYAQPQAFPSTTALTPYTINLVYTNFYSSNTNSPYVSTAQTPITATQFAAVMGSLQRIAIQADWHSGDDAATLDNVSLNSAAPAAVSAAPEPGS